MQQFDLACGVNAGSGIAKPITPEPRNVPLVRGITNPSTPAVQARILHGDSSGRQQAVRPHISSGSAWEKCQEGD